jgi:hypothetical protein
MALILAIEPDRRQASQLHSMVRGKLRAELVLADSAERALAALGDRVPDLILTTALLSPRDENALAERLRKLDGTAAHVQTLTIPMLASPHSQSSGSRGGVLSALIGDRPSSSLVEGCDPAVFAEQCAAYLERAAAERASHRATIEDTLAREPVAAVEPPPIAAETEVLDEFASMQQQTPETPSLPEPFTPEDTYRYASADAVAAPEPLSAPESVVYEASESVVYESVAEADPSTALDAAFDLVVVDDDVRQEQSFDEPEENVIELDLGTLVEDEEAIVKEFSVPNDPMASIASAVRGLVEAEEQAARAAAQAQLAAPPPPQPKNPTAPSTKKGEADAVIPARLGVGQLWPQMDSYVAERRTPSGSAGESESAESLAAAAVASMPAPPARRRSKAKPIEDEWGFFDPDQCGFAALLAKLEEIADGDDTPPSRRRA